MITLLSSFLILTNFYSVECEVEISNSGNELIPVSYSGYQILDILPATQEHLDYVNHLRVEDTPGVTLWTFPKGVGKHIKLLVSPEAKLNFSDDMTQLNLTYKVSIPDVQKIIDVERRENPDQFSYNASQDFRIWPQDFDLGQYHPLNEIYSYLDSLAATYPSLAEVREIGRTHEGRQINAIKIGKRSSPKKPAIVIDAGIHAREWIAPATCLYQITELLTKQDEPHIKALLNKFDWYFIPVLNPDGYAYTWKQNRMWRKNRRPKPNIFGCAGVDLNRNFPAGWQSSNARCQEIYPGPNPASEPESQALQALASGLGRRILLYVSYHSFGQYWLTPYSYKLNVPQHFQEHNFMAKSATEALKSVHGTRYQYGTSAGLLYIAKGTSADWMYDNAGVVHSYIVELRDLGSYGFLLPRNQILPTGEETWAGISKAAEILSSVASETESNPDAPKS